VSRVLVTGATGFVGRRVCAALAGKGITVRAVLRRPRDAASLPAAETVEIGDIDVSTPWKVPLTGVDAVIHLAARVHQTRDTAPDPLAAYRRVNLEGTRTLLTAAADAGLRRVVLVSTIKVHGERSELGKPFRASDPIRQPDEPYARSKWEAESALWELCEATGLEGVVVRPPLVYGPGVRANFLSLLRLVDRGIPLPLAGVRNERSLVFVGNLADLLVRSVREPAAAGRTLLVADGSPVSTAELLREVASTLDRSPRLVNVPLPLLQVAGKIAGMEGALDRLLGSLAVDDGETRATLGWSPPFQMRAGLEETVNWYRRNERGGGR
jgi:nucleoside-diphosphate-sugar epimerase